MLFVNNQIKAHQTKAKRAAMKQEEHHGNITAENLNVLNMYSDGFSVAQIADIQNRSRGAISSVLLRARKRSPDDIRLQRKFSFSSEKTKFKIKTGSILPAITEDLCTDVQKWIIEKTLEGNYETIASFFTDLVAEAYFADQ